MPIQQSSPLLTLIDAAKRCPRRAIFAVALLSVLVSCYPVVFFGRSFVSANAVPMPLHGIVLFAGGAAWGWDLKFILAKILFAFGTGLTILIATRHLPSAVINRGNTRSLSSIGHATSAVPFVFLCLE
jgi:hypothetical protein